MSEDSESVPLQFETAEFEGDSTAPESCTRCSRPLRGSYFLIDGAAACNACRNAALIRGTEGSGFGRFVRACIFGTIAGAIGAAIWYGIREVTGYEIGLISILVGLMVGAAVRAGSRERGGWLYQCLAVFLAYTAIVSTYVPLIIGELSKLDETAQAVEAEPEGGVEGVAEATPASSPLETAAGGPDPLDVEVTPGQAMIGLALGLVFIVILAYVAPFLGGFEGLLGLAIIGFGLWEAWRINRRVAPEISGPFRVGGASSPARPLG